MSGRHHAEPPAARTAAPSRRPGMLAWLGVLAGLVAIWSAGGAVAQAQAPVLVAVDSPTDAPVTGPDLTVRGWAYGSEGPGSGVDTVTVYLADPSGEAERLIGTAVYGILRPDVAERLGTTRASAVGYELALALPAGEHRLRVYARASGAPADEGWSAPAEVIVQVRAPNAGLDSPARRTGRAPTTGPSSPVPGSVVGQSACTHTGANGQCLAYSVANGGGSVACSAFNAAGECVAYGQSSTTASACAQWGPGGQCLAYAISPPVNAPPGGPGSPGGVCLESNAAGQCTRYSGADTPSPTTLHLSAQVSGGMSVLTWTPIPAARVYEVLRCATPQPENCSVVYQAAAQSYTLPHTQNYWYMVRARGADGQTLAISGFLGRL
jgi:hypothetical protein